MGFFGGSSRRSAVTTERAAARPVRRSLVIATVLALGLGMAPAAGAAATPRGASYLPVTTQAAPLAAPATELVGGQRTAIAWGGTSIGVAVAVSRALYTSSPGVLLVSPAAVPKAKKLSGIPAVPILVMPGTKAEKSAVRAELKRLGADWILPMGTAAGKAAKQVGADAGVQVVSNAPAVSTPKVTSTALLVSASKAKKVAAGLAVARLMGKRLGAQVIALHGKDPRADSAAIKKLAKGKAGTVIGVGAKLGPLSRFQSRVAVAQTGVQLPGGGQVMFPGRTLVALYGYPGSTSLGALGQQSLQKSITRVKKLAAKYRKQVSGPVVPAFEIISTIAAAEAGSDGMYSRRASIATLKPWVQAATKAGMYVVLDLQPGRANLLTQAKEYEELLKLPNVGLALDPEWKLHGNQKPLQQIGWVGAKEINSVITWLDGLVAANHLPQKVLVLHQFTLGMLHHSHRIQMNRDGVGVLIHMDGQGSPAAKESTWSAVVKAAPKGAVFGWKNFYVMDTKTLTPKQTMKHKPQPVMISYQ